MQHAEHELRLLLARNPAGWAETLGLLDEAKALVIVVKGRVIGPCHAVSGRSDWSSRRAGGVTGSVTGWDAPTRTGPMPTAAQAPTAGGDPPSAVTAQLDQLTDGGPADEVSVAALNVSTGKSELPVRRPQRDLHRTRDQAGHPRDPAAGARGLRSGIEDADRSAATAMIENNDAATKLWGGRRGWGGIRPTTGWAPPARWGAPARRVLGAEHHQRRRPDHPARNLVLPGPLDPTSRASALGIDASTRDRPVMGDSAGSTLTQSLARAALPAITSKQ
jgi:hypothetical protein